MRMDYSTITIDCNTKLYIANFSENRVLLEDSSVLTKYELCEYNKFVNNRRKEEYLLVRWLTKEVLNTTILYRDNGAPYLSTSDKISISHCSDAVVIMVSAFRCGVDVEIVNRDFERAAPRFITSNDRPITDKKQLAEYWCSKEAIYKAYSGDISDILSDIVIVGVEEASVSARVYNKEVKASVIYINTLIISYTTIK